MLLEDEQRLYSKSLAHQNLIIHGHRHHGIVKKRVIVDNSEIAAQKEDSCWNKHLEKISSIDEGRKTK